MIWRPFRTQIDVGFELDLASVSRSIWCLRVQVEQGNDNSENIAIKSAAIAAAAAAAAAAAPRTALKIAPA